MTENKLVDGQEVNLHNKLLSIEQKILVKIFLLYKSLS